MEFGRSATGQDGRKVRCTTEGGDFARAQNMFYIVFSEAVVNRERRRQVQIARDFFRLQNSTKSNINDTLCALKSESTRPALVAFESLFRLHACPCPLRQRRHFWNFGTSKWII